MNSTMEHLTDLLGKGLKLCVVGTAVTEASANLQAYYADPRNKFWDTLYKTRITATKEPIKAIDYESLKKEHNVGLTDLNQVEFGCDDKLDDKNYHVTEFWKKMEKWKPKVICFNGKKAAAYALNGDSNTKAVKYGVQPYDQRFNNSIVFVACSTSPTAKRWWEEEIWVQLADYVHANKISAHTTTVMARKLEQEGYPDAIGMRLMKGIS
jgi:double-stranded uracil-DNA glycosylase